jgi:uncharacterized membrane protein
MLTSEILACGYVSRKRVWSATCRWKISLSALLILLAVSAVILRLTRLHGFLASDYHADAPSALHWLYFALALAMAPTVIALGRLGGKIVYPYAPLPAASSPPRNQWKSLCGSCFCLSAQYFCQFAAA